MHEKIESILNFNTYNNPLNNIKLNPGDFIFNGVLSRDIGLVIQNRPSINTPKRKRDFKTNNGIDGNVLYDYATYENTDIELSLAFKPLNDIKYYDAKTHIFKLFNTSGYVKARFYFDPIHIYDVVLSDSVEFESKYWYGDVMIIKLKLTAKPYKYIISNDNLYEFLIPSDNNIINGENAYRPLVYVEISGNATIMIDNNRFMISGDRRLGGTMLDGRYYSAYRIKNDGTIESMINAISGRVFPTINSESPSIRTIKESSLESDNTSYTTPEKVFINVLRVSLV